MNRRSYYRSLWILPLLFAVHIVEESFHFADWVNQSLHGKFDQQLFIICNAVFMAVLLLLTYWAARKQNSTSLFLLLVYVSGQQFWDALFHLYTTVHFSLYSPGLYSALLLYIPSFAYFSFYALQQKLIGTGAWLICLLAGTAGLGMLIWGGLYQFGKFPWSLWI